MSTSRASTRCHRDISNFLVLRESNIDDDLAIGALLVHAFNSTYARKLPEAVLSDARRTDLLAVDTRRKAGGVWVLEFGNKIVGTFSLIRPAHAMSESWLPDTNTLRCLAVDPGFHGFGFSERLLTEADDISRFWGMKGICLHVVAGAGGVGRLYSRHGYLRDERGDREFLGVQLNGYIRPLSSEILREQNR